MAGFLTTPDVRGDGARRESTYDQEIVTLRDVERLTVSLEAEQVTMLRALAAAHDTTVSAVVRAAADALAAEHTATGSIRRRIQPDARGGARPGAGRPRSDAGKAA